ncbi:hypothetical protein [Sporosarcina sp. HYO08]|uniref:hypothetical protein n=1 Tax=Sporosarcina sp. HYO08 TaxID=1759557 RepID=UPI000795360F|nr:hypothetical protein [Sporosarcina sp. HYO08]KXH80640.1 hypothetical protein AU377_07795 [Sporosarcina sp. HYO08]
MRETGLKRGQPITFRLPADTSDHTLRLLQNLKDVERRNFSSKIAEFVIDGVNESSVRSNEVVMIPLPKGLTKAQRDWLKHEHSEALLGSILYQLLADPMRAAALFTSLNGDTVDSDLYFSQEVASTVEEDPKPNIQTPVSDIDDALDHFDWKQVQVEHMPTEDEEEEDPLADFLAQMNQ